MDAKHTKGPWELKNDKFDGHPRWFVTAGPEEIRAVACVYGDVDDPRREANARLIAAAPDHAMIAAALCAGAARWESSTNEFCIGGMCHSTKLDEFGVPLMTQGMRVAIIKALGKETL